MICKSCGGKLDEYGDCPYCGSKSVRVRDNDVVSYTKINENSMDLGISIKVPMEAFNSEAGIEYIRKALAKNLATEILKNDGLLCNTMIETCPIDMTINISKKIKVLKL